MAGIFEKRPGHSHGEQRRLLGQRLQGSVQEQHRETRQGAA